MGLVGGILAGALAVGGIIEGVSAVSSTPKMPGLPATPSLDTSSNTATTAQQQQRAAALATGGLTDYTGASGIILGADTKTATLVGS